MFCGAATCLSFIEGGALVSAAADVFDGVSCRSSAVLGGVGALRFAGLLFLTAGGVCGSVPCGAWVRAGRVSSFTSSFCATGWLLGRECVWSTPVGIFSGLVTDWVWLDSINTTIGAAAGSGGGGLD